MEHNLTGSELESLLSEIDGIVRQEVDVNDRTVSSYLFDTFKKGSDALRTELSEFPGGFAQRLETLIRRHLLRVRKSSANSSDGPKEIDINVNRAIPEFLKNPTNLPAVRQNAREDIKEKGDLFKAAKQATANAHSRHYERREKSDRSASKPSNGPSQRTARAPGRPIDGTGSENLAEFRKSLPVYDFREVFLQAVAEHQFLVVEGDTGCGKTTQLPQYLYEAGYSGNGYIACTQPRRVAATSVAQRVSVETGNSQVGDLVGYAIRFDNATSSSTQIKFMTDGVLQQEIVADPALRNYSVVMLDEAHERTVATDVLLCLLKQAAAHRPELKIIVASATLNSSQFSQYFGNCPVLKIPGRAYPVEIKWATKPCLDYLNAAIEKVAEIHSGATDGDILVFLTGQEEIEAGCEAISKKFPDLVVLPIFSALPGDQQALVFQPAPEGKRKVILATNIAETSLTIDGIRYVIDSGFSKVTTWEPRWGMETLRIIPISQAQAKQRSGRAGRTGPGVCYRLYTQESFEKEMPSTPTPEIKRRNMSHTLLLLKCMGIDNILKFDFLDPPDSATVVASLEELYQLGALNSQGQLTVAGRKMAKYPLEPAMAKTLLEAVQMGVAEEVSTIMALLGTSTPVFVRPQTPAATKDKAKRAHARFIDRTGDHMTLLRVFRAYASRTTMGARKSFCASSYLNESGLRQAADARKQLLGLIDRPKKQQPANSEIDTTLILKALCRGFYRNSAKSTSKVGEFKTLIDEQLVFVHPTSVLFDRHVEYVIYHSLFSTSREYMHHISAVKPEWLIENAPEVFSPVSKQANNEKLAPLQSMHKAQKRGSESAANRFKSRKVANR